LKLKLYSNSHSVSCSKVEVVLDYKSIEIDKIEAINNYSSFSPTGTVPCLIIDSQPIADSGSIVEYLEAQFPTPSLLSKDNQTNAKIRFMSILVEEKLVASIRKLFPLVKATSHPSDNLMISNIFQEIQKNIDLVFKLQNNSKFFATEHLGLCDCGTPSFFSMLKEFEIHFQKEIEKSEKFKKYELSILEHPTTFKEYKRYGYEIRNWISSKLLA